MGYFNSILSKTSLKDSFFLLPIKKTISSKESFSKLGKFNFRPLNEGYNSANLISTVCHSPDVLKVVM